VQNLVQFFNVGSHNYIRLEGADWNDGLDMAWAYGESVAFSAMYARNLKSLSELMLKTKERKIKIAKEIGLLLRRINYNSIKDKQTMLQEYFTRTESALSGEKISVDVGSLAQDLNRKASWMMQHIRSREWLRQGFFNGYYDNKEQRVEGLKNGVTRMMLASQAFAILSGLASQRQVEDILKSVQKHLWDKKLKGYHLNTDFKQEEHNLGRAFSFAYGHKENGAFFSHMAVIFAYALYQRGYIRQGWQVLSSIYGMAMNSAQSKIYPCLPEYFDLEGRGMYSYLTGSASWFILTLVNQVFGVRGQNGDLLIEPKLCLKQFKQGEKIWIERSFANRRLRINFSNPKKLEYGKYKITRVSLNSRLLPTASGKSVSISREVILNLPPRKINTIDILLG
jgi:cellobiose phosphorylase